MLIGSVVIIGFYCLGELTHDYLQLPIPGSVIGMLYLFLYLIFQTEVSSSLQRSGQLLISNLPLLLIPSSVGIVTCVGLLEKNGIAIVITLSISIVFSLIITAWVLNLLSQKHGRCSEPE